MNIVFDQDLFKALAFGISVAVLVNLWTRKNDLKLPPGPLGLPVLGYLPFLGKESYRVIHRLTLRYGSVFSFYLGRKLVVVVGDFRSAKETLSNPDIMDRPKHPPNLLLPNSTSVAVENGNVWKEQRQFSMQLLRQLGLGKSDAEANLQDEIRLLIERLSACGGQPLRLDDLLLPSVSNNIYAFLSGGRLDLESEERRFLNQVIRTMTLYFRPTIAHAYFPWLKWWLPRFRIWGYDHVHTLMLKFENFVQKQMTERANYLNAENVKCYLDGYLLQLRQKKGNSSFSEGMLRGNFLSFFGAGSTPARATIAWALACMIRCPQVQREVQRELDANVGRQRPPAWSDRLRLPYTMAVIMEVMRSNSIIPISMLRCAAKDTEIGGYDIPKGSIVLTNLWGIHHHPDYWSQPEEFRPERFLRKGKLYKCPYLIPFSFGKRDCPGKDYANMLVFLYFANILQNFSISLAEGSEEEFQEEIGIAKLILLNNVCLTKRK